MTLPSRPPCKRPVAAAVFAVATALAPHLAGYDVATVPDLGSLARAVVLSAARPVAAASPS